MAATNLTPVDGILPGDGFKLKVTVKDEAGSGVTGASALLTMTIRKPDGTDEAAVTGGAWTDAGGGLYTYTYVPAVHGRYYAKAKYDGPSATDRVLEGFFDVSPLTVT